MLQVCELDIIFNFEKAYFILDEFLMGGEVLETSRFAVGGSMEEADTLQEVKFTPLLQLFHVFSSVLLEIYVMDEHKVAASGPAPVSLVPWARFQVLPSCAIF